MIHRLSLVLILPLLMIGSANADDDTDALRRMVEKLSADKRELTSKAAEANRQRDQATIRAAASAAEALAARDQAAKAEALLIEQRSTENTRVASGVEQAAGDLRKQAEQAAARVIELEAKNRELGSLVGSGVPLSVPNSAHVGTVIGRGVKVTVLQVQSADTALVLVGAGVMPKTCLLRGMKFEGVVDDQRITIPGDLTIDGTYHYDSRDGPSTIWSVRQSFPSTAP